MLIPAKSTRLCFIRIKNLEIREGFLPPLDAGEGLTVGSGYVTNDNGKAYIYITNVNPHPIQVQVPVLELQPIHEITRIENIKGEAVNQLTETVECLENDEKNDYLEDCPDLLEEIVFHKNLSDKKEIETLCKNFGNSTRVSVPEDRKGSVESLNFIGKNEDYLEAHAFRDASVSVSNGTSIGQNEDGLKVKIKSVENKKGYLGNNTEACDWPKLNAMSKIKSREIPSEINIEMSNEQPKEQRVKGLNCTGKGFKKDKKDDYLEEYLDLFEENVFHKKLSNKNEIKSVCQNFENSARVSVPKERKGSVESLNSSEKIEDYLEAYAIYDTSVSGSNGPSTDQNEDGLEIKVNSKENKEGYLEDNTEACDWPKLDTVSKIESWDIPSEMSMEIIVEQAKEQPVKRLIRNCNNQLCFVKRRETYKILDNELVNRLGTTIISRDIPFFTRESRCLLISDSTIYKRLEEIKNLLRLEGLNKEESESIESLLKESTHLYHLPGERLSCTTILQHRIPTVDDLPINTRGYRWPEVTKDEIARQMEEMLENGVIVPSTSPYNCPVWVVPKKADSKGNPRWRVVFDYRALNEKTIADAYPIPNIIEILDQLGGARYFSVFDLASGFHQIEVSSEDRHKTAFTTPRGHFEFVRMPFGLRNAPPTFQRAMDLTLGGILGKGVFVYLDDIVIYAKNLGEHSLIYKELIKRLEAANLKLQPDKCEFLKPEVAYLGHVIGNEGVKPDPKKLEAVREYPKLKNVKNIRQFLGLTGYYRRFIEGYAKIAKPLTTLLQKDVEFEWKDEQQQAFDALKSSLCTAPVLRYPDFTKPFILTTDASGIAIGGILSQGKINHDHPVAYASRALNNTERKYDTYEKEALAIVYCILHYRPYLYGRKFTVVTDHKPLMWFRRATDGNARVLRWRLKLAEYEYDVVYKAGKTNVNADALSRNPVNDSVTSDEIMVVRINPVTGKRTKGKYNLTEQDIQTLLEEDSDEDDVENDELDQLVLEEIGECDWEQESVQVAQPEVIEDLRTIETGMNVEKNIKTAFEQTSSNAFGENSLEILNPNEKGRKSPTGKCPLAASVNLNSSGERQKDIDGFPDSDFGSRIEPSQQRENESDESPNHNITEDHVPSDAIGVDDAPTETSRPVPVTPPFSEHRTVLQSRKNFTSVTDGKKKRRRPRPLESSESDSSDEGEKDASSEIDLDFSGDLELPTPAHETIVVTNIKNSRDLFHTRKDNLVYFVSVKGKPLDEGAELLQEHDNYLQAKKLTLNRAQSMKRGFKFNIALPISDDSGEGPTTVFENIKQSLLSCYNLINKLNLQSISIAKSSHIYNIPWVNILDQIQIILGDKNVKIIICNGLVKEPPPELRNKIIEEMHSTPIGGHRGVSKTFNRIRHQYYWKNLKLDVQQYIQRCLQCQLKKLVRVKTKQPMIITDTPATAFDKIAMDIVGPMTKTQKENEYILTIQDQLTKFSLAIPLPNATAVTIAEAFVKRFICNFGAPKAVLTDQGSNFLSNFLKQIAKLFKIRKIRTTAFHPQSNGSLERSHHALGEYLKQFTTKENNWDDWVELAIFNYNTNVHEGTKHTPYEMVFGKIARTPSSLPLGDADKIATYDGYLIQLVTQIHEIQTMGRENLINAKEKAKHYHDQKINPIDFKVGESVFLLKGPKPGKLGDQYTGPHEVLDILNNGNVRIKIKKRDIVVHPNRLRISHIDANQ